MTKKEMKENLKKKCKDAWETYKGIKDVFGADSVQAEKALTKWVTYDDLFEELYNESLSYSFY